MSGKGDQMTHHAWNSRLAGASLAATAIAIGLGGAATAQELSEVVVTARRIEERLQDVPISITVLTPNDIAKRNIVNPVELATYTPSLSSNQRFGPDKATFALRGFTQEANTAPTVGVYFADVVGVRAQGGTTSGNSVPPGSFMDLQNVQVLKGPQGTLFGRNTTGGAILLVPSRPSEQFEGYVEGSLGNYDMRRLTAVVNLPINEQIRLRLGFDDNDRDGYLKNKAAFGAPDFNDVNYTYFRASLVVDVTPDLENYTIFHYSNSKNHGFAPKIVACDTNPVNGAAANPIPSNFTRVLLARSACAAVARAQARGDGFYDVAVSGDPDGAIHQKTLQLINTTTWHVNPNLTVKNIASYGEFQENVQFSFFGDEFFVPPNFVVPGGLNLAASGGQPFGVVRIGKTPGLHAANSRSFTEELQLQGNNFDNRLTWVVGGYLEFSRPKDWHSTTTAQFLNCTPPGAPETRSCANPLPGVGSYAIARTKPRFDNHGVFAQATWKATEKLNFTVGGRYTFDKIVTAVESTRFNWNGTAFFQNCNDVTRFFVRDAAGNPVLVRGARVSLPVSSPSQCHNEITEKSKKPTWLIEGDYKPVENVMLYAKYARGYRQGGMNPTTIGLETWGPEQLDAYEIGAKTSFDTGSLRGAFNIALFHNTLKEGQVFGSLGSKDVSVVSGGPGTVNAGKLRIKGVEIDASLTPVEGLRFDLGYSFVDSVIAKFTPPTLPADSPFATFTPRASEGDPLNFVPETRFTFSGSYTLPLPETVGELSVGATYTYTSKQLADKSTPVFGTLPESDLVNLNVNWNRVMDSRVDLALFVTNLTKEKYFIAGPNSWTSFGYADLTPGAPRMYGVRVRVNFGPR